MHLCAFPPPKINVIRETYVNVEVNRTSGVLLLFGSFWKGWNVTLCLTFYVTTKNIWCNILTFSFKFQSGGEKYLFL